MEYGPGVPRMQHLKARWDPNGKEFGERVYKSGNLMQEQAATLFSRARKRIEDQREELEPRFLQEQSAIRNAPGTA